MTTIAPFVPLRQDLPADLLHAFGEQFVNRPTNYCTYDPLTYHAERQYTPCTDAILAAHLRGDQPIALDARNRNGMTKWLCLVCDAANGLEQLQHVQEWLALFGLTTLVEAAPADPALWLFLDEPLSASALWWFMAAFLPWLRHEQEVLDDLDEIVIAPHLTDLFPCADEVIRLPLAINRKTRTFAPFVAANGKPYHGPTQHDALTWLLAQPRMNAKDLVGAICLLRELDGVTARDYRYMRHEIAAHSATFLTQRRTGVRTSPGYGIRADLQASTAS